MTQPIQGDRFNAGKPALSLVLDAPNAIAGAARVFQASIDSGKYPRNNWKCGLTYASILDSMLRHILLVLNGENIDPESGEMHAHHITCNALFLAEMMATRPDLDDRVVVPGAALPIWAGREHADLRAAEEASMLAPQPEFNESTGMLEHRSPRSGV